MNGPEGCPECGALTATILVVRCDRLVKRCPCCGHRWNEEREPEAVAIRNGYVRRDR